MIFQRWALPFFALLLLLLLEIDATFHDNVGHSDQCPGTHGNQTNTSFLALALMTSTQSCWLALLFSSISWGLLCGARLSNALAMLYQP